MQPSFYTNHGVQPPVDNLAEHIESKYVNARQVKVSYKICSVSEIDSVSCTFSMDMKLVFTWDDPKLIGAAKGNIDIEHIKGAFDPELEVVNEYELDKKITTKLTDSTKGTVKQSTHIKGKLSMMDMHLEMFPFDAQNLQLILKSHRYPIEQLVLVPDREQSTIDYHPQHEWRQLGHCMKEYTTNPDNSSTKKVYSSLHIIALVQREGDWFVNNILVVAGGLVLIALTSCSMHEIDQKGRNDVGVLTLLAAITNKFIVSEHLPKIPYRTLIDIYLDFCFVMHMIIIFNNVVVFDFVRDPNWGFVGVHINDLTFLLFIAMFGSFHLWITYVITEHRLDVNEWVLECENTGKDHVNTRRKHSYFHHSDNYENVVAITTTQRIASKEVTEKTVIPVNKQIAPMPSVENSIKAALAPSIELKERIVLPPLKGVTLIQNSNPSPSRLNGVEEIKDFHDEKISPSPIDVALTMNNKYAPTSTSPVDA